MVNYYTSEVYYNPTLSQMITSLKDGVDILTTQTETEVYRVVTDTAGEEYEVILSAGQGVYIDIHIASGNLSMSYGTVSSGVYTAYSTSSDSSMGHRENYPFYCELAVINGGDLWDFRVVYARPNDSNKWMMAIRSTIIESSLTSDVVRTAGIDNSSFSTHYSSFPYLDRGHLDNAYVVLRASGISSSEGAKNTPDGKVMLFPALLALDVACPLGVPTIGSKLVYSMIGSNMPVATYAEFVVGGSRFVSLGSVAIRSS